MPTVNPPRRVGIDEQVAAFRLQAMAGDVAKRFGLRMRERRRELKLTQKQVARRMPSGGEDGPVDAQRISDWERGYNEPSDRYKLELVTALDVPDVSYFYEDPEQPDVMESLSAGNGPSDLERQLASINERLARIEGLLSREQAEPSVGQQIHEAFEEMTSRLGREVGKRPPRSKRAADQSRTAPPAAA